MNEESTTYSRRAREQIASAGNRTRVTSMATMHSTTRPLMLILSARTAGMQFQSACTWDLWWNGLAQRGRRLENEEATRGRGNQARVEKRQRGGIEPLRVPMPRELKPRPSTSPTHSGTRTIAMDTRSSAVGRLSSGSLDFEAERQRRPAM